MRVFWFFLAISPYHNNRQFAILTRCVVWLFCTQTIFLNSAVFDCQKPDTPCNSKDIPVFLLFISPHGPLKIRLFRPPFYRSSRPRYRVQLTQTENKPHPDGMGLVFMRAIKVFMLTGGSARQSPVKAQYFFRAIVNAHPLSSPM